MSSDDKPYQVGYGRPPVGTRFQPGQSGNPAGRAKGSRNNFKALVQAAANRELQVTVAGQRVTMTKTEVFLDKLFNDAIAGDARLRALVVMLLERHLVNDPDGVLDTELLDRERELLRHFRNAQGACDEPQAQ